jgi:hypothetical protein
MTDAAPLNVPLIGTGEDGLALYCGRPRSGRTSYCAEHRRINLCMVANVARPKAGLPARTNLHMHDSK